MKRTTYILIGLLISVLVLMVAGILYISTQGTGTDLYTLTMPDKTVKTEFAGIRAVKLYASGSPRMWLDGACLDVLPSSDGKIRLSSPESDYLKVSRDADTLVICLDLTNYEFPKQKNGILPALQANNMQLVIEADANLTYLSNFIQGMHIKIRGLQSDSLTTYTKGKGLQLDSCHIHTLRVDGNNTSFVANKSTVSQLYLDLDGIYNWSVHECTVDTEHLTGSGKHHNNLQKGECRQVVWTPKEEGAELSVTFSEEGRLVLEP